MKIAILKPKLILKASVLLSALLLNFSTDPFGNSANAQVLLDAHSNASGGSTWYITTSQPNELILISAGGCCGVLSTAVGTVTVNGNNATYMNGAVSNGEFPAYIWAYEAPTAGTYTLVCNESGLGGPWYFNFAASVYQPSTPLHIANIIIGGDSANMGPLSVTASVTTTKSNSLIYGYIVFNDNAGSGNLTWNGGLTMLDKFFISNGVDAGHADSTMANPGTYTIQATDTGATNPWAALTLIAVEPSTTCTITTTANTNTDVTCNGANDGIAIANPTTGAPPYTYSWSPGGNTNGTASGLSAATYTVTVTDNNGCSGTASTVITEPTAVAISIATFTPVICNGGTGDATANAATGGTSPYTYSWSPNGGTGLTAFSISAGTYTITATDNNGCTGTASVNITQPSAITYTHDSVSQNGPCNGVAAVTPAGGVAPYTYLWTTGNQTTDTIKGQCAGTYCCIITDNNGCSVTTCVTVILTTGINNTAGNSSIEIYPNPSSGQLFINGLENGMLVEMYDYTGRKISEQKVVDNMQLIMDITNKDNGVYLIQVLNKDGVLVGQKKVVKTN